MAKIAKELSALAVSKLSGDGAYAVGGVPGLHLQIIGASRVWVLRFMVLKKRRRMGLGSFPQVSLAKARELAREAHTKGRAGIDPIDERRLNQQTAAAAAVKSLTFSKAIERYIASHQSSWKNPKHHQQWENTLSQYAEPLLGQLKVSEITTAHVMQVLDPIWRTKTETASRLRGRMEQVLDWATVQGLRDGLNPARWRGHLDHLLPKPVRISPIKHHTAIPVEQAARSCAQIRMVQGMGSKALQLLILTACRSGEVRGASWTEFDLVDRVWTIPPERMKAGKEHRVPLSDQAVALLQAQPRIAGTDLVFPSSKLAMLSDMTLTAVMRRLKLDGVPHGWRSTFRDWAGESTSYPREVVEQALAHAVGNKVELAYRRRDMLEKRRTLMQDWSIFLLPVLDAK
jgi:integrase